MDSDEIGRAFADALTQRDFDAGRALLAEDVRFRMLVPGGLLAEAGADVTMGRFAEWFGDAEPFDVEASQVGSVEGRATITYRFRLQNPDGWQVIEQHMMLDIGADSRITSIDSLCSGFRSIATCEPGRVHRFDAGTLGCAEGLSTQFRRHIQQIPVGDVLIVSTSDPAAKEDLPPLARMMGHAIRSTEALDDGRVLVSIERRR